MATKFYRKKSINVDNSWKISNGKIKYIVIGCIRKLNIKIMMTIETNEITANLIKTELVKLVPFVSISKGALGNDSLYLLISFDKKENWSHGYVENSNYCRIVIYNNGIIEGFVHSLYKGTINSENRLKLKFRKSTAKNLNDAIVKLSTYLNKVKKELE